MRPLKLRLTFTCVLKVHKIAQFLLFLKKNAWLLMSMYLVGVETYSFLATFNFQIVFTVRPLHMCASSTGLEAGRTRKNC